MISHLGVKTYFSLGESILSPKDAVEQAKKAGFKCVAIADTSSVNALVNATQKAKEEGIKLIFGSALVVVDDLEWRKAKRGQPKPAPNPFFHAKLLARTAPGMNQIMKLLTLANTEGNFYEKAQIDFDQLLGGVVPGDVTFCTGVNGSIFTHSNWEELLDKIVGLLGPEGVLLEVAPVCDPFYDRINKMVIDYAEKNGLTERLVVTRPALHKKGDSEIRNTMGLILGRNKVGSMWRTEPNETLGVDSPIDLKMELVNSLNRLVEFGEFETLDVNGLAKSILINTINIHEEFDYQWEKLDVCLPNMAKNPTQALAELAKKGWKRRVENEVLGYKPPKSELPIYAKRLRYEMEILKSMGFENYFLLVEYVVSKCKERGIMVGPGRGSAGGSLVSFLVGITDVDPIRFGLISERFINPERLDLPDVDLDFMSSRREEVIDFIRDDFGEENVAGISNYSMLGSKSALRDVGSAYDMDPTEYRCSKLIPDSHGEPLPLEEALTEVAEIEKFAIENPEAWDHASRLQGCLKSFGRHAAGVIVAGEPVANRAVVERRSNHHVVNWDKRVVEDFGLVKLDILGLQTLDLLNLAANLVKESTGIEIDYLQLPLDDKAVLESFGHGKTVAVFQFESGGMRHLLKSLAAAGNLTFEEIAAATALYRPGPIESGLMDDYIAIKEGAKYERYPHPSMEKALKETRSVIIYQEQVMGVSRDLAGFSMAEADHLRKAMGKKDPEKMAKMRDQWVDGCFKTSGMDKKEAEDLFNRIEQFAGYGFNKSHAIEYTVLSYWSMWVKINHPAAFYAAALTILSEEKRPGIVKDAAANGIGIMPPDINKSSLHFLPGVDAKSGEDVLYAPFQMVKGLSDLASNAVVEARDSLEEATLEVEGKARRTFRSKEEFVAHVNRRRVNIRGQESLDKVGAFAEIEKQIDPRHPDRLRDQKTLLPGLMMAGVKAERDINVDAHNASLLADLLKRAEDASQSELGLPIVYPHTGKAPKMVIVMDVPNGGEVKAGVMGAGKACESVWEQVKAIGLSGKDVVVTSLVKCEKGDGVTNQMTNLFAPYLDEELQILQPPVIVALGSKSIRHLMPDVKGGWEELCGQVQYDSVRDATICFGLNPGMLYHDPGKVSLLKETFANAKELIS